MKMVSHMNQEVSMVMSLFRSKLHQTVECSRILNLEPTEKAWLTIVTKWKIHSGNKKLMIFSGLDQVKLVI